MGLPYMSLTPQRTPSDRQSYGSPRRVVSGYLRIISISVAAYLAMYPCEHLQSWCTARLFHTCPIPETRHFGVYKHFCSNSCKPIRHHHESSDSENCPTQQTHLRERPAGGLASRHARFRPRVRGAFAASRSKEVFDRRTANGGFPPPWRGVKLHKVRA